MYFKLSARFGLMLVLALISMESQAQEFSKKFTLSALGGSNFAFASGSSVKEAQEDYEDVGVESSVSPRIGIHLGVNGYYEITDKLQVGAGVIYSQRGYKENKFRDFTGDRSTKIDHDLNVSLNYLDVPLNLRYNMGNFYALIGPNISILMGSKYKYEAVYETRYPGLANTVNESEDQGTVKSTNGLLAGYNLGLGVEGNRIGFLMKMVRTGKASRTWDDNDMGSFDNYGYSNLTLMLGLTVKLVSPPVE